METTTKKPNVIELAPAPVGHLTTLVEDELRLVAKGPIRSEDLAFLREHSEQFQKAHTRLPIWRTRSQRDSILSDDYQPTVFGKFRQAIIEQRGMFDEAVSTAIQYDLARLDIDELDLQAQEHERISAAGDDHASRMAAIAARRCQVQMRHKALTLARHQQEVNDRIREVRIWQERIDELIEVMRSEMHLTDDQIWDVEYGEVENCFFDFLTRLKGIQASQDGAEVRNLYALARHGVRQVIRAKTLEKLIPRCSVEQTHALCHLGYVMDGGKPVNLIDAVLASGTQAQVAYARKHFTAQV